MNSLDPRRWFALQSSPKCIPGIFHKCLLNGLIIITESKIQIYVSFIINQSAKHSMGVFWGFIFSLPGEIQKNNKTLFCPQRDKNWWRRRVNSHEKRQQQKKQKDNKWLNMWNLSLIPAGILTGKEQNGHCQEGEISRILGRFHGDCEPCSDPWKAKRTWINWRNWNKVIQVR